jgi:predicted acyl esterase
MAQEHSNRAESDVHVIYRKITEIQQSNGANYNGFSPSTTRLSKGHVKEAGRRALQVDTLWERDMEIPLRDGTILRADVFRPAESSEPIPALVAFAPFGKSGTGKCGLL